MDNIVNFTINLNGTAYTGVAQLDEALGNVLVDVQKTQSWFGSLKDAIGASSIKLDAFIGVVEKVSQAFQSLVGSSLDFEQQQANMRTLLNGDTEATDNLIGKIREYGKATVYDRSVLIEAQKTMMAFGLDAEYAFGKLKNIGDIALGDKQKMQSLALAFSQMSSTGKLMGQDLLQMINAGFNPLEVISQKTGKSIAELKEEMGKGAISAEMVAQAFEWATEEGGRFYQGAETAAQTTAGKIAKVKDQIDDFKISLFEWSHGLTAWIAEMGNMVVPISQAIPMFKVLYNISSTTFKHLKSLDFAGMLGGIGRKATEARISLAFMRKDIETCGMASLGFIRNTVRATMAVGRFATVGLFNAVKGMGAYLLSLVTGGAASRTFANVATASFARFALSAKAACRAVSVAVTSIPIIGWIAAAVAAVIGLVTLLWNKSEGFRRVVLGTWESVKAAVSNAWQYVKTAVQIVWTVLKHVFQWYLNIIKTMLAALRNAVDRIVETVTTLWEHIREIFTRIGDFIHSVWNRVCESFGIAINWIADKLGRIAGWVKTKMVDPIRNAFTGMWDVIRDVFDKILTKLGKLFAPIRELWNKLFPKDKMKDVKLAYAEGADKGTKSWEKSKSKGDVDTGKETIVLDGKDGLDGLAGVNGKSGKDGKTKKELSEGTLGKNAGTVAGKAQQITIKLENMVGTMNFNGGLRDNASNVESTLTEMMARILGMAETAA
jgi:tape measure domain-containing protein